MQFIEILTTLIILFVTINLIWVIYKKLNMKMREGLTQCTSGCVKHTGIDGDCDNKIYKEGNRYYKKCSLYSSTRPRPHNILHSLLS